MTSACIALPTSPDAPLLLHGDCLDLLATLPDASVHVVVTDPPAAIVFMGRDWDRFDRYQPRTARGREVAARYGDDPLMAEAAELLLGLSLSSATDGLPAREDAARIAAALRERYTSPLARLPAWAVGFVAFMTDVWSEVDRVLKPGGFVCAWALPKTADLAGLAMRAVGWTIHDSVLHLFSSGMPKGQNIGKAIDRMHGAEREVIGKRISSVVGTSTTHAQDDWSRVHQRPHEVDITAPATEDAQRWDGWNTQLAPGHEQWLIARKPTTLTYAANVLAHHTGALHVDACRIPRGDADREAREAAASQGSGLARGEVYGDASDEPGYRMGAGGSWPRNVVITRGGEECPAEALDRQSGVQRDGVAVKRNGVRNDSTVTFVGPLPAGTPDQTFGGGGGASRYFTRFDDRVGYFAKASDRTAGLRSDIINGHPTHKSVALMSWIVRLLAATAETTGDEAAIVLDCFMGSGPTGVACVAERVRFIGIERDESSFEVARARILAAIGSPEAAAEANEAAPTGAQLALL